MFGSCPQFQQVLWAITKVISVERLGHYCVSNLSQAVNLLDRREYECFVVLWLILQRRLLRRAKVVTPLLGLFYAEG